MVKVVIAAALVVSAVAGIYLFASPKKAEVTSSAPQLSSRYVDYSSVAYAAAADKKRVLYFYATWCPTCSVANEDFTVNAAQIPDDVIIFRTDYDAQTELKRKYAITYQHTFVQVDANGNELSKWNGGGLTELIQNLK